MKSQQQQIDELKDTVDRLARELSRVNARNANVRIPRMGVVLGKTTTSHTKGSTHDVTVYGGTPLSEATTSLTIPATNKFADLASGKWVVCIYIRRAWYLISGECA